MTSSKLGINGWTYMGRVVGYAGGRNAGYWGYVVSCPIIWLHRRFRIKGAQKGRIDPSHLLGKLKRSLFLW